MVKDDPGDTSGFQEGAWILQQGSGRGVKGVAGDLELSTAQLSPFEQQLVVEDFYQPQI